MRFLIESNSNLVFYSSLIGEFHNLDLNRTFLPTAAHLSFFISVSICLSVCLSVFTCLRATKEDPSCYGRSYHGDMLPV